MTAQTAAPAVGTAAPASPTSPARVAAGLAVVVALLGGLLGPGGQLDGLLGSNAITVEAGHVEAQVADGWFPMRIGSRVQPGATLRAPAGRATLGVPGGTVDLAEGTRVTADDRLRVEAGTVVVDSSRTVVGDDATRAQGTDTWRYDAAGRASAYSGSVVVTDGADREVLVRSLREARLRDGVLATDPRPYVYTDTDEFDRQHLATAFDVDDYLAALRQGLQGQYGTAPQVAAFYTDFDGLDGALFGALGDVGFERAGDRVGPPADVLVASVVTEALVVDAGLAPDAAAGQVRDLRLAGATWGLVVQGHDLDASHVRAAADRALARRQLAEQQGTAVPVEGTPASDGPPSDVTGQGDPASTAPAAPQTGEQEAEPEGAEQPAPPGSEDSDDGSGPVGDMLDETGADDLVPGEGGDALDDAVDTVDEAVEEVGDTADEVAEDTLGSVGEAVDGVGEAVGQAGDTAGDVADEVTDAVGDAANQVTDAAGEAVDGLGGTVGGPVGGVGETAGEVADGLGDTVDGTLDGLGDTVDETLGGLGDAVDGTVGGVGDTVDGAFDAVEGGVGSLLGD